VVVGELVANGSYIRLVANTSSPVLYRLKIITENLNLVAKVVGEGNSSIADDYSIIIGHSSNGHMCITHNSGPSLIKMYRDNDHNYYLYIQAWGHAIVYFENRVPTNNTTSATKVDVDVNTLIQVGI